MIYMVHVFQKVPLNLWRESRMIKAINDSLMATVLLLQNYINDESHDCVAFYRPVGGP